MKTLDQIIELYKSETLDGRDLVRLCDFVPPDRWHELGVKLKEGADISTVVTKEFTRDNVLEQLRLDVAFGFEKALNKRGISAGLMYEVVEMWTWVLEEGLQGFEAYAQYGLPLFKATAIKYGFPDEIDGFNGDEFKFSAQADY